MSASDIDISDTITEGFYLLSERGAADDMLKVMRKLFISGAIGDEGPKKENARWLFDLLNTRVAGSDRKV